MLFYFTLNSQPSLGAYDWLRGVPSVENAAVEGGIEPLVLGTAKPHGA